MSIENEKDNIIAILKENGYDTNSPDTISLLSSIINNRIVNYIHNDKDTIIRILSENEYNKYIINGTCDGTITKTNIDVWHFGNETGKSLVCYYYSMNTNSYQLKNLVHYSNYEKYQMSSVSYTYIINILYELSHSNNTSNVTCIRALDSVYDTVLTAPDGHGDHGVTGILTHRIYPTCTLEKNVYTKESNQLSAGMRDGSWHNLSLYFKYVIYSNFRPVFQYKDNNKSKNLYY